MEQYFPDKVEAVFALRTAVEQKVHAEIALEEHASAEARDALLDATLDVEAKTQAAIEVCHECGHAHEREDAHDPAAPGDHGARNVINVDFGR